jgi:hypothetical protein
LKTLNHKVSPLKCRDCGSNLVLVDVTTYTINNNPSSITQSTYRCSNKACQAESDKREAKRLKVKKDQEEDREARRKASAVFALKPH